MKFSKEFNEIYQDIYGYKPLPTILDYLQEANYGYYGINHDCSDIASAYENRCEMVFRMIDQNRQDQSFHLLEIKVAKEENQSKLQVVRDITSVQSLNDLVEVKKNNNKVVKKTYPMDS